MKNPIMFFKEKNDNNNEIEEISERKTSKLGYFLLFIMVIFLLVIGQTVFGDLQRIVKKPSYISSCITNLSYGYNSAQELKTYNYRHRDYDSCNFGSIESKFRLNNDYQSIENELKSLSLINGQISNLEAIIRRTENSLQKNNNQYDVSLQEKIADEQEPVLNKDALKQNISDNQLLITNTRRQINNLESDKLKIISKIEPTVKIIYDKEKKAKKEYDKMVAFYNIKVFFLKFLFIFPILAFSVFYYLKLKKSNSPYTIIYAAITAATSLLFLQIISILLFWIIPKEFIAEIFRFFLSISILRYILYYGVVIIVIFFFGGIVYYIQKRVYNSKNIAMRRLRDNKCPNCSFLINMYYNHCPKCGRRLKKECEHCGNLKIADLPHCPNCGN